MSDAETNAAVRNLLQTTADASVWAAEWCKIARRRIGLRDDDEGWMIGWFAAAIEAGRRLERERQAP